MCPVATCELRDHRMSHTRRRALTPPCLPAGGQQFCGPQSRQAGTVAPGACCAWAPAARRALWMLTARANAPRGAAYKRVPSSPDGRKRRQRQGPGPLTLAPSRSRTPTPGNQVESMSSRCLAEPTRAIKCAKRVTAEMAVSLASRMFGGAWCSKTTSLQAASARSFAARSSAVNSPLLDSGCTLTRQSTEHASFFLVASFGVSLWWSVLSRVRVSADGAGRSLLPRRRNQLVLTSTPVELSALHAVHWYVRLLWL